MRFKRENSLLSCTYLIYQKKKPTYDVELLFSNVKFLNKYLELNYIQHHVSNGNIDIITIITIFTPYYYTKTLTFTLIILKLNLELHYRY